MRSRPPSLLDAFALAEKRSPLALGTLAIAAAIAFASGTAHAEDATFSALQGLFPHAQRLWEVTLPADAEEYPIFLADEIALHRPHGRVIHFFGLDGRLRREAHLQSPPSYVFASPRGDALLGTLSRGEGQYEHSVFDAEGRLLWSAALPHGLDFSPSGQFLVSSYDELASRQAPAAFRVSTGEKTWTDSTSARRWRLAATANDTLVCYEHERLRLIDLRSGALVWQSAIKAGSEVGVGRLVVSPNGRTIAAQNTERSGGEDRLVTRVWDGEGRLRWERAVKPAPGETNGGVLTAVSDGGAWVALDDLDHLTVVRAEDGQEVWRLEERKTCCIRAFTDAELVQERGGMRLFRFDASGKMLGERKAELPIEFRSVPASGSEAGTLRAVHARRAEGVLRISAFSLGSKPKAAP